MKNDQVIYPEPHSIADWEDGMVENFHNNVQKFEPKFHFIRLIVSIRRASKEKGLDETDKRIIGEIALSDYPDLADEIRELFPELTI